MKHTFAFALWLVGCGGAAGHTMGYVEGPEEAARRIAREAAANPPVCEITIARATPETSYPSAFDYVGAEARSEIAEAFRTRTGLPWTRVEVSLAGHVQSAAAYSQDFADAEEFLGEPWSHEAVHRYAARFASEHLRRFGGEALPDASGCAADTVLHFLPPQPRVLGEPLYVVRWASSPGAAWNFNVETARIPPHARPEERSDAELTERLLPVRAHLYTREVASQNSCECDSDGICTPCAQQADGPWERAPTGSPYPLWLEPTELLWQRGTFQVVDANQERVEVRRVAFSPSLDPEVVEGILGPANHQGAWMYMLDAQTLEQRVDAVTGETFEGPVCRPLSGDGHGYSEWQCDTPG